MALICRMGERELCIQSNMKMKIWAIGNQELRGQFRTKRNASYEIEK